MALFEVNSTTKISYEVFQNAVPTTTLFIHGNLASNRWWTPSIDLFKSKFALAAKNEGSIICVEFRGCGNSSVPQSENAENEITMQNLANDFILLVRSLKLAPVNLVGHSTGGLIAAMMLAMAPELFNKAYLLDPVGAEGVKFDQAMIKSFDQMKENKGLTGSIIGSTILNNDATSTFFNDVIVEDAFKAVRAVGHLVLKALDGLDVRQLLSSVQHPVLVVHGEKDQLLPMTESEKMAKLFKNGQFQILPGCGHCANIENPKLFTQSVSQFLFS